MVSSRAVRFVLVAAVAVSVILGSYLIWTRFAMAFDLLLWALVVTGLLVGSVVVYLILVALASMRAVAKPVHSSVVLKKIIAAMHETGARMDAQIDSDGNISYMPSYDILQPIGNYMYWRYEDNDPEFGTIKKNIFYDMKKNILYSEIKADELNVKPELAIRAARVIIENSTMPQQGPMI